MVLILASSLASVKKIAKHSPFKCHGKFENCYACHVSICLRSHRLDFNNNEEKELVEHVFKNAIEALSSDDQMLPQVVISLVSPKHHLILFSFFRLLLFCRC